MKREQSVPKRRRINFRRRRIAQKKAYKKLYLAFQLIMNCTYLTPCIEKLRPSTAMFSWRSLTWGGKKNVISKFIRNSRKWRSVSVGSINWRNGWIKSNADLRIAHETKIYRNPQNSLGIESRWGGGARFSAPVQAGPGDHPASCTMGTGSFRE